MVLKLELHQNPLEGLLKMEIAGLHPQSCDSVGLGEAQLHIQPGDVDAAGPGTTVGDALT